MWLRDTGSGWFTMIEDNNHDNAGSNPQTDLGLTPATSTDSLPYIMYVTNIPYSHIILSSKSAIHSNGKNISLHCISLLQQRYIV